MAISAYGGDRPRISSLYRAFSRTRRFVKIQASSKSTRSESMKATATPLTIKTRRLELEHERAEVANQNLRLDRQTIRKWSCHSRRLRVVATKKFLNLSERCSD
jgi:hypothetical protein